jgi:hypothetical protein
MPSKQADSQGELAFGPHHALFISEALVERRWLKMNTSMYGLAVKQTETQSPKSRKSKDCNREVNIGAKLHGQRAPPRDESCLSRTSSKAILAFLW